MSAAIRIDRLTVAYTGSPALQRLSGTFAAGSLTAVVGPNGAGKSTLLAAIVGRVVPTAGHVDIAPGLRRRLAYLPQQSGIDRSFPVRVRDLVMLGHWAAIGKLGAISREQNHAATQALDAVGLDRFREHSIGELSVGQFQRVLFARVLLQDAMLILLDEPFNAIDTRTTADLLSVIRRWHGESRTVVVILHDMKLVRAHFPESLLLAREPIAWGATPMVLRSDNLARARRMAGSWDDDRWRGRTRPLS